MKNKSYQEKRKNSRQLVFEAAGWKCEDCGAYDLPLRVHYCARITGADTWQHGEDMLMALCEKHYVQRKRMEESLRLAIGRITRRMPLSQLAESLLSVHAAERRLNRK